MHPPAGAGEVLVRFNDATDDIVFDLGRLESFSGGPTRRTFKGTANAFNVRMRLTQSTDGTSRMVFTARNGDLTMFAGTSDVSMVLTVQVGADAYMYSFRFKRMASGLLILR